MLRALLAQIVNRTKRLGITSIELETAEACLMRHGYVDDVLVADIFKNLDFPILVLVGERQNH